MNDIKKFFNKKAFNREQITENKPIVAYEQKMRSKTVISMLSPKVNEKILEVGCGSGRDIVLIAQKGATCIGVDSSINMVKETQKELKNRNINGVTINLGDATQLMFPDEVFDKILCSEVIEHIPDYEKAISEMARVLKPSGCLVLSTPNRNSIYGFERYVLMEKILKKKWFHPYDSWKTFKELSNVLKNNGFRMDSFLGVCYIPGFIVSYRLPSLIKKILVFFIANVENILSRILPKNGYMIAIKAIKLRKQE